MFLCDLRTESLYVLYFIYRLQMVNSVSQQWIPLFYVHGTVHRNSISINVQQNATFHSVFYL